MDPLEMAEFDESRIITPAQREEAERRLASMARHTSASKPIPALNVNHRLSQCPRPTVLRARGERQEEAA